MPSNRLLSLDAFRGYTIAAMILVNNPGDWGNVYAPLLHKSWNGITPTDLIFPFFLFIMGVAITLAFTKKITVQSSNKLLYQKILIRTLKIFALGLFLNLLPHFNFSELRVAGVLQRIAVVYFFCSILFLNTGWKAQSITGACLLFVYWLCMILIPTPGNKTALLEPGNNLAAWIDSILLPGRMWQGNWDPEGIFSTVPAIVTGIAGMLTGKFLLTDIPIERKIIWMFIAGIGACILGYVWSWNFPLNKNLWTSSYVLVTGGLACMAFAVFIYLIDVLQFKSVGWPGIVYGANAIIIYVVADLLSIFLCQVSIGGDTINNYFMHIASYAGLGAKFSSLIFALLCVIISFMPAYWLFSKKVFFRL